MNQRIVFINLRSHFVERMEPLYAAKKLGVEVILVCDKDPRVDESYVKGQNIHVMDTYDMDKTVEFVQRLHKQTPISGVATWADKDVELVARIAQACAVPGLSIEASRKARNKYLMRHAIAQEHPELCPKFMSVTSLEELKKAVHTVGTPGVLKPVGASGSKSIIKVYDDTDLDETFKRLIEETRINRDRVYSYFPNQYIYEELMDGDEMSFEGIVSSSNNEILIAGMTDKYVTDYYSTEYKEIEPSQKNPELLKRYAEQLCLAIRALGIQQCSFHAECKVKGSELKVIEIAARPGGEFITTHLLPLASGFSFVEEVIKNALGRPINESLAFSAWSQSPRCIAGHLDLIADVAGIVTHIGGLQIIAEDPNIVTFLPLKEEGDDVVLPPDDYSSLYTATMIARGADLAQIEHSFERAARTFQITISKR